MIINERNIDSLLMSRHAAKAARRAGKRLKGPAKRTKEQNKDFEKALLSVIKSNLS